MTKVRFYIKQKIHLFNQENITIMDKKIKLLGGIRTIKSFYKINNKKKIYS